MKKIEDLFKTNEGMTIEGSTVEQRHEIWELLFNNNLIYGQGENLELEHNLLGGNSFYLSSLFPIGFSIEYVACGIPVINIPFEDFKTRLLQLND